jgi:hypothetical protein
MPVLCNALPALRVGDFRLAIGDVVIEMLDRRFLKRGRCVSEDAAMFVKLLEGPGPGEMSMALEEQCWVGVSDRSRSMGSAGDWGMMGEEGGWVPPKLRLESDWLGARRPEEKRLE